MDLRRRFGNAQARFCRGAWLVVLFMAAKALPAAGDPPVSADPRFRIEQDAETLSTRVIVKAHQGQVAWADLMAALAQAKGYDDEALDDVPRHRSFDLNRLHTRLVLTLMNALGERHGIGFTILPPDGAGPEGNSAGGEPSLQVTLDRRAMLASRRRFEKWLRLLAADGHAGDPPQLGITFPQADAVGADRVIVLHGLGSTPEAHASLSADLRQAGLHVGQFAYAGDESLEASARLLSRELKRLRQETPELRLRLVTLSMGGLVARRVLEDELLDAGNVTQLVLVAAPNQGSVLAYCGFGLQIWQFLDDPKARGVSQRFYDTVEDGLSEAADDLCPDSEFLKHLNGLKRNPRIRYSLLLGSGAPLSQHAVDELRQNVAEAEKRHRFIQFLGPKLDRILSDSDELIYGKGDGVVALKRGRLEGVDDVLTLDFHHLSIGQPPQTDGEERLRREIIHRLLPDGK